MVKHEAHKTSLPSFRVITLNAAHGRKLRNYPCFRRRTVEKHLSEIAAVLKRERPDVVGLQEVDGNSCLSGNFDHVERLAGLGDYAHYFLGEHVSIGKMRRIAYGTAILSRLPLKNLKSVTFDHRFPSLTKGFVMATISPAGAPHLEVDIVSVHLACLRRKARHRQVAAMVEHLGGRKVPLVVLGDLNCQWGGEDDSLRRLAYELNLQPQAPDSSELTTFHLGRKKWRLDWILVSPQLRVKRYQVLPDKVSDHFAVLADIEVVRAR
jgi:endonuclease/exonuclease/phosphatase family metal-dependent hydrolase